MKHLFLKVFDKRRVLLIFGGGFLKELLAFIPQVVPLVIYVSDHIDDEDVFFVFVQPANQAVLAVEGSLLETCTVFVVAEVGGDIFLA